MTTPCRKTPRGRLLAAPANRKLGPTVYSWSIPEGQTCPGATEACLLLCYVRQFRASAKARYGRNLVEARRHDFVRRMIAEVHAEGVRTVRIHVAGDFFSAGYTRQWATIARSCPETTFLAYTRSWRVPAILRALRDLAAVPNVRLWFSEDRDTGPSPAIPGVRVAFLADRGGDTILVDPARHNLVFRTKSHRAYKSAGRVAVKRLAAVQVCPAEQRSSADRDAPEFTCDKCRICLRPAARDILTIGRITTPAAPTAQPARRAG